MAWTSGALAQGRGRTDNSFFWQMETLLEVENRFELEDIFLSYLLHCFSGGGGGLVEIPSSNEFDSSNNKQDRGLTFSLTQVVGRKTCRLNMTAHGDGDCDSILDNNWGKTADRHNQDAGALDLLGFQLFEGGPKRVEASNRI